MVDQACGCEADSGDPDYACDCAMQGLQKKALQKSQFLKIQKVLLNKQNQF